MPLSLQGGFTPQPAEETPSFDSSIEYGEKAIILDMLQKHNWNKGKKQEFVERMTYYQPENNSLNEINETIEIDTTENHSSDYSELLDKGASSYILLTTPSCPNCPQAKELLRSHPMTKDIHGIEKNAQVPDEKVLDLIKQFNISSVPTVVFFDDSKEAISSYSGIYSIQQVLNN